VPQGLIGQGKSRRFFARRSASFIVLLCICNFFWTDSQKKQGSAIRFHRTGVLLDLPQPIKGLDPLSKQCRAFGLFHTSILGVWR